MNTEYSWETGIFGRNWKIFRNYRPIGFLKSRLFSRNATAELNDKQYRFRDNKWYSPSESEILNTNGEVIGKIVFDYEEDVPFFQKSEEPCNPNTLPSKFGVSISVTKNILIQVNDETSVWEYKSKEKNWRVRNPSGLNILYSPSSISGRSGQIEASEMDEVKILAGIYAYDVQARTAAWLWYGFIAAIVIVAGILIFTDIPFREILRWIF